MYSHPKTKKNVGVFSLFDETNGGILKLTINLSNKILPTVIIIYICKFITLSSQPTPHIVSFPLYQLIILTARNSPNLSQKQKN